jgi:hypothetical protein
LSHLLNLLRPYELDGLNIIWVSPVPGIETDNGALYIPDQALTGSGSLTLSVENVSISPELSTYTF